MTEKALKLAYEVLLLAKEDRHGWQFLIPEALVALKEVWEQPEQEPVAWRVKVETKLRDGSVDVGYQLRNEKLSVYDEPLYTTPPAAPEQEPVAKVCYDQLGCIKWNRSLIDLPEEGTELYTAAQRTEQEPVAYCNPSDPFNSSAFSWPGTARSHCHTEPLYTIPSAQRTWVGLTDEERVMCRSYDVDEAVAKTEAKLKEKNNG